MAQNIILTDVFSELVNLGSIVNNMPFLNMLNSFEDVPVVLKKECFDKLKIALYKTIKDTCNEDSCTICMDDLSDEELVRILPCSHIFHRMCIDKWLDNKDYKCPNCRNPCGESFAKI
jgi:hypothetical protein